MLDRDLDHVLAKFFLALGDETRLELVAALKEKRMLNVGELSRELAKEQSHISHHLACLRDCGIVRAEKKGRYIYYSLNSSRRILRILKEAEEHVIGAFNKIAAWEVPG
jgi:DNA-binding transcriptional ArsR family regulator